MHFLILAKDATDDGAQDRRTESRDAHVEYISGLKKRGHMLIGAARLDKDGKMIGSAIMCDFPDRAALEIYLADEPYIKNNVWEDVDIEPIAIGPSFLKDFS